MYVLLIICCNVIDRQMKLYINLMLNCVYSNKCMVSLKELIAVTMHDVTKLLHIQWRLVPFTYMYISLVQVFWIL